MNHGRAKVARAGVACQIGNFGFDPALSTHHFQVILPPNRGQDIPIVECFSWETDSISADHSEQYLRVTLPTLKWQAIAEEVRAEFNRRLLREDCATSRWAPGKNLVRRDLGKELVVLAWAIEDADPGVIPIAITNWLGLVAEERWWLYTQAAAATGDAVTGRGRGWRKAIRFALTENPVGPALPIKPTWMQQVDRAAASQASLFSQAQAMLHPVVQRKTRKISL
jgi:hypothetical protein